MAPNGAPGLDRQLLLDVLGGSCDETPLEKRLVIAGSMEGIMNLIIRSLIKLGILKKDLDYHLLCALLVMICLFFGYQKWFDLRGAGFDPLYQSRSPHLLVVPPLRHSWSNLLSWRLGMAIRSTVVRRILEQEGGDSRGSRLMSLYARNFDNHSFHTRRLGHVGKWIPCNDRKGCIPDERSCSPWCFCVLAAARCHKSLTREDNII